MTDGERAEQANAEARRTPDEVGLHEMQRHLELLRELQSAMGTVWPGIGLRGRTYAFVKRFLARFLKWLAWPQHQFNISAVRLMARQMTVIENLAKTVGELERQLAQTTGTGAKAAHLFAPPPPAIDPTLPFGFNVLGFITSEKGLGEAARSVMRSFGAGEIPYVCNSFVDPGSANVERLPRNFSRDNPHGINLISVNAPELIHVAAKSAGYLRGRYNIGYWNWELPTLPPDWHAGFAYVDEVWVPTRFVYDAVAKVSPGPVTRVPLSIDPEVRPDPAWDRRKFGIAEDTFIFLFFFDFHSFFERKNPDGLIRAFRQAFGDRRDVQLLIKSSHARYHQRELLGLKKLAGGANVRVFEEVLPRAALYSLIGAADCYVSLHRSEGFGLTLSESMLCGKPVIATGHSGNMDFMTEQNSFPVRYKLVEIARDAGPYRKGNWWAEPDIDHAAELMLRLEGDRRMAAEVGARGRADVLAQLHPATIGAGIRRRLEELGVAAGGG